MNDLQPTLCHSPSAVEMTMTGDPPTEGWRYWAFIAGLVVVGLFGVFLMLTIGGDS